MMTVEVKYVFKMKNIYIYKGMQRNQNKVLRNGQVVQEGAHHRSNSHAKIANPDSQNLHALLHKKRSIYRCD